MEQEELLLFSNMFERTFDLVCIVDKQGWFKHVNPAVLQTLGFTRKELFSEPVSARIHPDDRALTKAVRAKLLDSEPLLNFQNRYVTRDGRVVWLQWTSVYIPENEVVFAIAKDITVQRNAENETENNFKKYKELTTHFKNLVEKDRQFFASELHEEIGQLASVVKINFEWICSLPLQLDDASRDRMENGLATAKILIDKIRKLSYSINPSQINELGLDAVLRSVCNEFCLLTGISCKYESSFKEDRLSHEIKLDLFRICQEALANVIQHAQATEVAIQLIQKKNKIELSVRDNGKGFEHENKLTFGLKNMHRRVASINGEFAVKSKKSKGTTVSVSVET
jgi:PAS domain S-box-containing protein